MYMLFGDDSGNLKSTWKVYSGICISELGAFNLKNHIAELKAKHGISTEDELKPLKTNYRSKTISKEEAEEITYSIYQQLANTPNLSVYGIFFLNKAQENYFDNNRALEEYYFKQACDCLYNKFDKLLANPNYPYEKESEAAVIPKFGIIILDEPSGKLSPELLRKLKSISSRGTQYATSENIFWGISVTDSDKNFGIEAAGFTAFALGNAINKDDLRLVELFKDKICKTSSGCIDNFGFTYYDRQRRIGKNKDQRANLIRKDVGDNYLNFAYN